MMNLEKEILVLQEDFQEEEILVLEISEIEIVDSDNSKNKVNK